MNKTLVICAFALALALTGAALAADAPAKQSRVTFYQDVLPILQDNCQVCHRPGGANLGGMVAPMAFETYEEARPWAKAMAKAVGEKSMPPWHAAPEQTGHFMNERTLTDEQIETIVAWSKTGAARGNQQDAPAKREWPSYDGWTIGEPDLILSMPEAYFIEDDVEDIYQTFNSTVTEEQLPESQFIKAIEFRPGSAAVHHIIAFPLGGIAPGNEASVYPEGISRLLEPGTDISWQMHYHKEAGPGTGMWDQSQMAIKFYPEDAEIKYELQGNSLGRFDFEIPAGDANYTIERAYTFKHDSRIVSMMPHMHLRGASAKYEAFYPDGTQEILLDVAKYDFNWQTSYEYKDFKQIPAGTKVVLTTGFDNSVNNVYNPDPTQTVRWGEPTTDEMSFGYMSFINDSGMYEPMFGAPRPARKPGDRSPMPKPNRRAGRSLADIIPMFDSNGDGMLQKEEVPGQMSRYFDMMDQNKDGAIDLEEAKAADEMRRSREQ